MPRKKKTEELVQASLGHRISKHEAICAERMKTLFKAIDEMRKDIKELRQEMNKVKLCCKLIYKSSNCFLSSSHPILKNLL